ncbi:MAG TPA: LysR substrate-binding domain-containing protein [Burkholderiales bacterium]
MAALPTLRQLQYLEAIAAQLNFTRAAASCHVTQSTLSAGLKELESVLGAQLVERDRQHVLMTPLGLEVAARGRELLAGAADLAALGRAAAAPMRGRLRLGVIPTIAPFLLPKLLPALRKRHPALQLALREDLTARLLGQLEAGELDFALIALPYDTGTLRVKALFDDAFRLVGPADEAALAGAPRKVTATLADRLLLLEEGHCLRAHTLAACKQGVPASQGVEATSLLTLVQMVASGMGLALVPEMALASGLLAGTGLAARPLAAPVPTRTVALAARRSSARLADFDALAARIAGLAPSAAG